MKRKYIQLPKPHLSYSQIQLWKQNKKRYIEIYFKNRKELSLNNQFLEFGKVVADALEKAEDTGDVMTDATSALLPKYEIRDKEIFVDMKTPTGYVRLIAKPDTLDPNTGAFREYKTGKADWTQYKADKHFQIPFYATVIYLKYGKIIPNAYLDWMETYEDPIRGIQPTGKVLHFKVDVSMKRILETMKEVTKVALEIEREYAMFQPSKALKEFGIE
jgi:hypothetical protein